MPIRLVISIQAAPRKGARLAAAMRPRCRLALQEPGCLQFEVFQSAMDADRLTLLELWEDQAALDAHAELNKTRPPIREGLRLGTGQREDYEYNRVR